MTNENMQSDPLDSVMDAEYAPRPSTYFGQVGVDVWYAVLEKGVGKIEFDPTQHSTDRRVTAIKIAIDALKRDGTTFVLEREMIAESKEWATVVKPSLRAVNADLRGINNKWVQATLANTGRTWVNKQGETKQATTIKFLAIYDTNDECLLAAEAFYAKAATEDTPPTPATTASAGRSSAERDTAAKFLGPLWKASGNDLTRFTEILSKTAPVNKYFTLESPEVLTLIQS